MTSTANIRSLARQLSKGDISCEELIKDRLALAKQSSGVFVSIDEQSLLKGAVAIDQQRANGKKLPLLADGMEVAVEFYQEKAIGIKLPANVIVEVDMTDPVIKGSTVTSSYKPAMLTNGLKVMVPPYLTSGEKIVIKTEDLTFVERDKS